MPSKKKSKAAAKAKPAAKAKAKAKAKSNTKAKPPAKRKPPAASSTMQGQLSGPDASAFIDRRIQELADWRGDTLAKMRALIREADPAIVEEVKWMGVPIWSHDGIVCTGETYTKVVKLTFANGAKVADPSRLFNSSLAGNTRRAIDIPEGAAVDADAFRTLVKAAVALNASKKRSRKL